MRGPRKPGARWCLETISRLWPGTTGDIEYKLLKKNRLSERERRVLRTRIARTKEALALLEVVIGSVEPLTSSEILGKTGATEGS